MKPNKQPEIAPTETKPAERRQLLGSATLGAVGLLFVAMAVACGADDEDMPSNASGGRSGAGSGGAGGKGSTDLAGASGEAGAGGAAATAADIEPLNALLTAEYHAITAYTAGAGLITGAAEADALYALRSVIVEVAVSIQSQHKLHAEALVDSITSLGGTPVAEATIAATFVPPSALLDNPTISNVLKFAASAERNAAIAYNQVLAGLEDAGLRYLATAIEGDETQHFIVLAALVLGLADPGPELTSDTAANVFPAAFVGKVGSVGGLGQAPPDYFG